MEEQELEYRENVKSKSGHLAFPSYQKTNEGTKSMTFQSEKLRKLKKTGH